jgi:hypothetical protein
MPGEFEIAREVLIQATPEQLWETIATEAGLAAWFFPSPVDPDSEMVASWEPGQRLVIRTPPGPDGSLHAFEYLIEARDGGSTVLRFVHSGVTGDDWNDEYQAVTSGGWDMYLYTLAQYHRHFSGQPAVYIEAEGPASSAAPGAWDALTDAVTGGTAELGTAVRVQLAGLDPVEGVIDYLSPNFAGLRTAGALIRFHGRWPLGMTVAVSHHAYTGDIDIDRTRRAWAGWLAEAVPATGARRA